MNVFSKAMVLSVAGCAALMAGCGGHPRRTVVYGAPPQVSADRVARIAGENGFRDGRQAGRFDAEHNRRPDPRRASQYRAYPGWAADMGDRGVYRDFYQAAFVRGYQEAYGHR